MNSSMAASTIAARRSAARVARFEAGAASGMWLPEWTTDAEAALEGFFVIHYS